MKIINRPRRTGKTQMIITAAHVTGYPIITFTENMARHIAAQARSMGFNDIRVYSLPTFEHLRGHETQNILIDEAELIIQQALNAYLRTNVIACTLTIPFETCLTDHAGRCNFNSSEQREANNE